MLIRWFLPTLVLLTAATLNRPGPELPRSPTGLALLPGGRFALTANRTANSVSLVDLDTGQVLADQAVGQQPIAVAVSREGTRAAVACWWSGTVTLLDLTNHRFHEIATVPVGRQ